MFKISGENLMNAVFTLNSKVTGLDISYARGRSLWKPCSFNLLDENLFAKLSQRDLICRPLNFRSMTGYFIEKIFCKQSDFRKAVTYYTLFSLK